MPFDKHHTIAFAWPCFTVSADVSVFFLTSLFIDSFKVVCQVELKQILSIVKYVAESQLTHVYRPWKHEITSYSTTSYPCTVE